MLLFVSAVPLRVFRNGSINPRGNNGINHERGRDIFSASRTNSTAIQDVNASPPIGTRTS